MSFIISTGKCKIKNGSKYAKQDISEKRVSQIQQGAGKTENVTIEISKKFLDMPSDLYLQGPKDKGIEGAKDIIKTMKERGKDACKKAKKHLKRFIEERKDGSKPSEEQVARAVFDAFVLYQCGSKHIKLTNRDLTKQNK
ncbi:hypothetical protein CPAV1605_1408 [seawater metagenome]|uniref:Uncharacterized protein n=1 Tax=seawater metagenome TaxID=1561972 RepID=A0A5E8CM55_9ZZZZ